MTNYFARDGIVVPPGHGRTFRTATQEVTLKVTGGETGIASAFEVVVPPGFDVGAHVHTRLEELFYVLEGELDVFAFEPTVRTAHNWQKWKSPSGNGISRATAGTVFTVPPGCPHGFANPTENPARMFFLAAPPPDHERYFEELMQILSAGGTPDPDAILEVRNRYDVQQLTPLKVRGKSQ